jgi:hypothetical protein
MKDSTRIDLPLILRVLVNEVRVDQFESAA